jgi:hypothetical protein
VKKTVKGLFGECVVVVLNTLDPNIGKSDHIPEDEMREMGKHVGHIVSDHKAKQDKM